MAIPLPFACAAWTFAGSYLRGNSQGAACINSYEVAELLGLVREQMPYTDGMPEPENGGFFAKPGQEKRKTPCYEEVEKRKIEALSGYAL
jgi:hypothetical protein